MNYSNGLYLDLESREDKKQQTYYLGKLQYPGTIDLSEGITFLIFVFENNTEELQICSSNRDKVPYSKYTRKSDRLSIDLDRTKDLYEEFYTCKIKLNSVIDCTRGVDFIIFTANQGKEQLQIVGKIDKKNFENKSKRTEILYKNNF